MWVSLYVIVTTILYVGAFYGYRELTDNGADDVGASTASASVLY